MNETLDRYAKHGMQSVSCVVPADSSAADFKLGTVYICKSHIGWIAKLIATEFNACGLIDDFVAPTSIAEAIHRFYDEYLPSVPPEMRSRTGSTSDDGLLASWLLLHVTRPDCYVESGVFLGSSLRLADFALPQAAKWAYDLSFSPLLYKSENIAFVQNEWSIEPPDLRGRSRVFAFFDDHIDPVRRILECYKLGIEWALFDDVPTFSQLHPYRYPAVPSISMIVDENMPDGAIVEWTPFGEANLVRYTHSLEYCKKAKTLILGSLDMRGLMFKLGLNCGDKSVVRLRRPPG